MKALLDTNILLLTADNTLPVFQEIQRVVGDIDCITLQSVVDELHHLCDDGNATACTAHSLVQSKPLKIVSGSSDYADADIKEYATNNDDIIVITHDRELIKTLKNHEVTVYRPRQRTHLVKAT